jgi:hypothetical protein
MGLFVWSKVQVESGRSLPQILVLKETERLAGDGVFWWGVGTSLDRDAVRRAAEQSGGALPVLFSLMLSRPKTTDVKPEAVYVWTQWEADGDYRDVPAHVLTFSRAHGRKIHHALVCRSSAPLTLLSQPFNPRCCRNHPTGKPLGDSQVTALLKGELDRSFHYPNRQGVEAESISADLRVRA